MVDQVVAQPDIVDDQGNISLHGREGLYLPVSFLDIDDDPRDVSSALLYFEVQGKLRKALAAGGSNDERVIVLTRAEVAAIGQASVPFALIDETFVTGSDTIPDTLWEGKIKTRAYTSTPGV